MSISCPNCGSSKREPETPDRDRCLGVCGCLIPTSPLTVRLRQAEARVVELEAIANNLEAIANNAVDLNHKQALRLSKFEAECQVFRKALERIATDRKLSRTQCAEFAAEVIAAE